MALHIEESGEGDRVAVLVHGLMGSGQSWWRIAPVLAHAGYRVLAVDLPGHGLSPRDQALTIDRAATALAETVVSATTEPPALAMGHSLGGLVLAAAASVMRPDLAVYVDAPFTSRGGWDRAEVEADYEEQRAGRSYAQLRMTRPTFAHEDCVVESRAAELFDPATAASIAAAQGGTWLPTPGSIVVRADPSDYIDDAMARKLEADGVDVRGLPGAEHTVWRTHFDEFLGALPEIFGLR
jgi:alpha-beta hydrolase superfamily lysophospholipase